MSLPPVVDAEYVARVTAIKSVLGQWRGAKAAAAAYLSCHKSEITRWLRLDTVMSGERLVKLERFCRLPRAEQESHLPRATP